MMKQNKRVYILILLMLISFSCIALGPQNPPIPDSPPSAPPPPYPIDGGILIGMAFGLFYGVKKLWFVKAEN